MREPEFISLKVERILENPVCLFHQLPRCLRFRSDGVCLFPRLLGEKDSVNIGQDTTRSDGDTPKQLVELFIILDSKGDVTGDDASLLVIAGGVASEFKGQVFQDSSQVD